MRQQIVTFASEVIATNAAPVAATSTLSAAVTTAAPGANAAPATTTAPARTTTDHDQYRRPAGAVDVGRCRRASASHAVVRYQLDAAGGRAEGGRLRAQVGRRADDHRGPGGGRLNRIDPAGPQRLHEQQGAGARDVDEVLGDRRHRVRGRRRQHRGHRRGDQQRHRRQHDSRPERARARHVQQRRPPARVEDAGRSA